MRGNFFILQNPFRAAHKYMMTNPVRTLLNKLDSIEEATIGQYIDNLRAKNQLSVAGILASLHINPKMPTFLSGAPPGFEPYPGSKEAAYNRFWNSDVCPIGQCKEYNRAHGVSFWAAELGGDAITRVENGRATMMIKLPSDYDEQIKARRPNIWDRCQVYIKK